MDDGILGKTARRISRAVRRASAPCRAGAEFVSCLSQVGADSAPCRAGAEFVSCLVAVGMVPIPPRAELVLSSFRV